MKPITRRHAFEQSIQWAGTLAAGMTVGGAAARASSSGPKPKIIVQTSLRHTSGRMEFLLGYTWSKVLDNASNWGNRGQINVVDHKLGKALSAVDMAHHFIASYSYEIPFDRLDAGKYPRLTRGWVNTGVTRFATGLPVWIRENDDRSLLGTRFTGPTSQAIDEPDFTPGPLNIADPRLYDPVTDTNPHFNRSLFSQKPL